ncbi:hypothetical protein OH491_16710 [Termitidicoccus mucosus]|uniref:hypothetical protein n=1 Tax=Termitidicoccus mucosus TaxID=1184151 RepID=UPI003183D587
MNSEIITSPKEKLSQADYEALLERVTKVLQKKTAAKDYPAQIQRLKELNQSFWTKSEFKRGDIVSWKDGLKNRNSPEYDEPVIVVDVLAEPVFDLKDDSGSGYFREPLDLILALPRGDVEFTLFYYDSRRFKLVER